MELLCPKIRNKQEFTIQRDHYRNDPPLERLALTNLIIMPNSTNASKQVTCILASGIKPLSISTYRSHNSKQNATLCLYRTSQ